MNTYEVTYSLLWDLDLSGREVSTHIEHVEAEDAGKAGQHILDTQPSLYELEQEAVRVIRVVQLT